MTKDLRRGALNIPEQRSAYKSAMESGRSLMQGEPVSSRRCGQICVSVSGTLLTRNDSTILTAQLPLEERVLTTPHLLANCVVWNILLPELISILSAFHLNFQKGSGHTFLSDQESSNPAQPISRHWVCLVCCWVFFFTSETEPRPKQL